MRHSDGSGRPLPFDAATAEAPDRPERVRVYPADAPQAEWEDESVDLGGEG